MPKLYTDMRDKCYERKRKKGKLTEQDKKDCKKMSAIRYFKETGKPVRHAEANLDEIDLIIEIEQLEIFGSFSNYRDYNSKGRE